MYRNAIFDPQWKVTYIPKANSGTKKTSGFLGPMGVSGTDVTTSTMEDLIVFLALWSCWIKLGDISITCGSKSFLTPWHTAPPWRSITNLPRKQWREGSMPQVPSLSSATGAPKWKAPSFEVTMTRMIARKVRTRKDSGHQRGGHTKSDIWPAWHEGDRPAAGRKRGRGCRRAVTASPGKSLGRAVESAAVGNLSRAGIDSPTRVADR